LKGKNKMINKEAENINKLTDFALDCFGIKDPLKKTMKCPSCGKEVEEEMMDGFECISCSTLRAELNADARSEEIPDDEDRRNYLESIYF